MSTRAIADQSYAAELVRKGIHLSSLAIPILYYYLSRQRALSILVPLFVLFLAADVARLYHVPTARIFTRFFGFLLRPHEKNERGRQLTGATYVLLSATICVLVFPKVIVITAFAILIVSDSAAALIGRKFGRHPFLKKSAEGSLAFLATALIVVGLAPKIGYLPQEYLIGAFAALVGAFVEAVPISIDDNVSIPVSVGVTMWVLYSIFLPTLDIFRLDNLF